MSQPSHKPRLYAIASLAILLLTACSSPDSTPNTSASTSSPPANAENTSSSETPPVERVVVLSSLAADLVAELDVSRLVGVPNSNLVQQNPKYAGIETMGVGQTPNLEAIVEQQPDLVVGVAGMQTEILTRLEELGIATLEYDVNSLADLDELATTLADRLNTSPEAVRDRYASCREIPETASEESVLLLAGSKPTLSPTRDSWAGNLLETFKVNNLAAQWQGESPFSGYVTLSPEKIVAANPDRLWVIATPDNADPLEGFKALAFWDDLQATEGDRVRVFDYYGLINPGSLDKIEATCTQLKTLADATPTQGNPSRL